MYYDVEFKLFEQKRNESARKIDKKDIRSPVLR